MRVLERILGVTLPIFAVALAGFLCSRAAKPDLSGAGRISVEFRLLALIFTWLSAKEFAFEQDSLFLAAPAVLVLASGLLAWPLTHLAGVDATAGCSHPRTHWGARPLPGAEHVSVHPVAADAWEGPASTLRPGVSPKRLGDARDRPDHRAHRRPG